MGELIFVEDDVEAKLIGETMKRHLCSVIVRTSADQLALRQRYANARSAVMIFALDSMEAFADDRADAPLDAQFGEPLIAHAAPTATGKRPRGPPASQPHTIAIQTGFVAYAVNRVATLPQHASAGLRRRVLHALLGSTMLFDTMANAMAHREARLRQKKRCPSMLVLEGGGDM